MKNNKYKIVVLSDLTEKSDQALSYAAKLSNEIDANVELFHAKAATEVSQIENPYLAISAIRDAHNKIDKEVKHLAAQISKENKIKIKTTFAFGNVKNEIENFIKTSQPDMIILGERKQKRFNFFGDNITQLVHKNFDGVVFVVTDENVLDSKGNVSLDNLGLKNNIENYNVKEKKNIMV
ncbi:universal stress protein [Winogradskyella sp. R77965]|uniref:universal stress protein n=1 Tax=Winogradskyella sp. R77965 TaxID=3093872 RepID=UPI0037DD51BE